MISSRARLAGTELDLFRIDAVTASGLGDVTRLPVTVKILLEMLLRGHAAGRVEEDSVRSLARWPDTSAEVPFRPARVLMQDFTGVPAVVDLAAMRAAMRRAGGTGGEVDPEIPVDLVIDHSVQVDAFGSGLAYQRNIEREYERNWERYALLRWAQQALRNFTVIPPGMGICHQVNLEHLSRVVQVREDEGGRIAVPDTLVGTDSHTTMVNGLGVLGWGVGGIEAEAAMLGQPMYLPAPVVVGVRFSNSLPAGTTATDLVLTLTEMLRRHGVVNKFVEFCGDGLSSLTVADRATLSNMCPEYGATSALFPVDEQTLRYLRATGRDEELVKLVELYWREQSMFRLDGQPTPEFSEYLELDLASVEPSLAGPRRPQDRVALSAAGQSFETAFPSPGGAVATAARTEVEQGSVVIAAITSCTNTSNPSVMMAAGLLAKKAVEAGLNVKPFVKTSLAPGSRVVTDYLDQAGLTPYLERLGFYLVGYGCTTCIGNSGPLASPEVEADVQDQDLNVVAVLSGNRNFEARIHPLVRASYLASPPLVVAYALAGNIHLDLTREPLGTSPDGAPIMLADLWPSPSEVEEAINANLSREMFDHEYERIYQGDEHWRQMESPRGEVYAFSPASTYVQEPPYLVGLSAEPQGVGDVIDARVLVKLGDSVTTDHISPASAIPLDSPAGQYLIEHDVSAPEFNSYGSRRGNDRVMVRGTFGNIRLRNELAGGKEGGYTRHQPSGELMSIFEAAERYRAEGVPLIILAGKEYGSGSSRDWAAKGPNLLGVKAVIAESYERIHRANLVGMGILPLQFMPGESRQSLGLSGEETYSISGLSEGLRPHAELSVEATTGGGEVKRFKVLARIDNPADVTYLENGGVLPLVLRQMMARL
ncbi:MAG TPA: aconitate hydratase AcnA [Candidatus Nitrosotalea sp.]|nr:aconitate hydratase AcnA [Candidatus Nitrosotalea sp.]